MGMYRIRVLWTGVAGSPYYSNFYFAEEVGDAGLARNGVNAVIANMMGAVRSDLNYRIEEDVAIIDEVTGDIERIDSVPAPLQGQGTNTNDPLPPSVQGLVRLRTGVYNGGREVRGKIFVPGACQTESDLGVPTVGYRGELTTRFDFLRTYSSSQWVVWSRARGAYAVVNGVNVWDQWASLRSRRD